MSLETKGLIHKYLRLITSYHKKHQVVFIMYDYLEDILDEAPVDIDGTNTRFPAKANMVTNDRESPLLNRKIMDEFHRRTIRLLLAAKRAHIDIQLTVAYLCTRMKAPN